MVQVKCNSVENSIKSETLYDLIYSFDETP